MAKITMLISQVHLQRSMNHLKKNVAVSPRFLTVPALRAEFNAWNKKWNRFRMRVVKVQGGGYAGVLRVRKR